MLNTAHSGLVAYDRRHGWRGPLAHIPLDANWQVRLNELERPAALGAWHIAVVTGLDKEAAWIRLSDGTEGFITMDNLEWARKALPDQRYGVRPHAPSDVLAKGDVIAVAPAPAGRRPRRDRPTDSRFY